MCLISLLSSPYHNQSLLGIVSEFNLLKVNLPSHPSLVSASLFSPCSPYQSPIFLCLTFLPLVSLLTPPALSLTQGVSFSLPRVCGGDTMLNPPGVLLMTKY